MSSVPSLQLRARAELELRKRRVIEATKEPTPSISLRVFAREAWYIADPSEYIHGWHIDAIYEHLEAVATGEIRNLIINMPPRHMKSLALVFWQAWLWTWKPKTRFFGSSYDESLAIRDAVKMRDIVESHWYQTNWALRIKHDQNQKRKFDNVKGGFRFATSVNGRGTGEGGDILLVDDPHNKKDTKNPDILLNACEWWDKTISTRGNSPKTVAKLVIMQRLHDLDLSGHLLRKMKTGEGEHYEHLILPARYDQSREPTSIGWVDPRRTEGELLWEAQFDDEAITLQEKLLGDEASGQLQQNPQAQGGNIFLASMWEGKARYDYNDPLLKYKVTGRWLYFDTALKDKDANDNTAWTVAELLPDYRLLIREVRQKKLISALLPKEIELIASKWNFDEKLKGIIIEDKGSGTTSLQTLALTAPKWVQRLLGAYLPEGSKEYRARNCTTYCYEEVVLFPEPCMEADWLYDFADPQIGELFRFPNAEHDDRVDTFTSCILHQGFNLQRAIQIKMGQAKVKV